MDASAHLGLFFLIVLGVVALPGMDMTFVLASALSGGRRGGLAAVAGIISGGAVHVVAAATGVAVVLVVFPLVFKIMLVLGSAYVAWIGVALLRSQAAFSAVGPGAAAATVTTYRRAALTNLLNPKAYLFMLAIFPQFLLPQRGSMAAQALILGGIIAATQAAVYGSLALAAAQACNWLMRHPAANRHLARCIGALLIATAIITASQLGRRP